jgi:hypothetical protein
LILLRSDKAKAKGLLHGKAKLLMVQRSLNFLPKSNLVVRKYYFELTNNKSVQIGLSLMLWGIDELISYVSIFYIKNWGYYFYGTPAGVAAVKPDDVLKDFGGT